MSECGKLAVLVITRTVEGTATSLARARVDLCCGLEKGHDGPHHDLSNDERWQGDSQTVFRQEDEAQNQEPTDKQ